MDTYINILIGIFIGIFIYNLGFFRIIEGLRNEQISNCYKTRDTIYKNAGEVESMQEKLKSLEKWQAQIARAIKLNTGRNSQNRDSIKRTTQIAIQAANDKKKEMEEEGEIDEEPDSKEFE